MSAGKAMGLAESDSEDELPGGWEERTTGAGRVYYAHHGQRSTQWTHPRTGKEKRLQGPLPPGWARESVDGRVVFVQHAEQKTSFTDPRLAFAREVDKGNDAPRQKFDASTKATHVLHGVDLRGKTVLVTGATSGVGFETARILSRHNAHIVLASSSLSRAEQAKHRLLQDKDDADVDAIECDLSRLSSVRRCADKYLAMKWRLDILILNAGILGGSLEILEESGVESAFGVNHLGHFFLARLLTKALIRSAPSRVVVVCPYSERLCNLMNGNIPVSSESHRQAPYLEPNLANEKCDLEAAFSITQQSKYWYLHAYNMSKFANLLFAFELNRRLCRHKVTVNAVHPGNMIWTGLTRKSCLLKLLYGLARPFVKSIEQAASTPVFAAVSVDLSGVGGAYVSNCWFCPPHALSMDEDLQRRFWELSETLVRRFEHRHPIHEEPCLP